MAEFISFVRRPDGSVIVGLVEADTPHAAAIKTAGVCRVDDVLLNTPTFNIIPIDDNKTIEQFVLKFTSDGPELEPMDDGT